VTCSGRIDTRWDQVIVKGRAWTDVRLSKRHPQAFADEVLRSVPAVTPEEVLHRVCDITVPGDMDHMPLAGKLANHPIRVHAGACMREDGQPCE